MFNRPNKLNTHDASAARTRGTLAAGLTRRPQGKKRPVVVQRRVCHVNSWLTNAVSALVKHQYEEKSNDHFQLEIMMKKSQTKETMLQFTLHFFRYSIEKVYSL